MEIIIWLFDVYFEVITTGNFPLENFTIRFETFLVLRRDFFIFLVLRCEVNSLFYNLTAIKRFMIKFEKCCWSFDVNEMFFLSYNSKNLKELLSIYCKERLPIYVSIEFCKNINFQMLQFFVYFWNFIMN